MIEKKFQSNKICQKFLDLNEFQFIDDCNYPKKKKKQKLLLEEMMMI